MTTIEKLAKLATERNGLFNRLDDKFRVYADGAGTHYGDTPEEAVDKAYEAAFPTRKLEPGDLFTIGQVVYLVRPDGGLNLWDHAWVASDWTVKGVSAYHYTIIGKALDEVIEVKHVNVLIVIGWIAAYLVGGAVIIGIGSRFFHFYYRPEDGLYWGFAVSTWPLWAAAVLLMLVLSGPVYLIKRLARHE
jgi:hypothetical protein